MRLLAGTRLGPYEVLAPVGQGGMGEVYRAKDTRLDRIVAIKVLPEEVARHPERKARFEREAKTISQLNHPNICTLHDIGAQAGVDYLVLELVEGETLAERLRRGRPKLDQALEVAAQIAQALDAAHCAGIVHRDLKPGNIMLTKSGVKLLDFGLAKLLESEPISSASEATTRQLDLTDDHAVVGTLHYMAPEQLEGKSVDARADLFALGAVLYELVTGERAFDGDSAASVIGAILEREPSPPPASLPPLVAEIIRSCLRKEPDERLQSARDVALALDWVKSSEDRTPPAARRAGWLWPALAGAFALALAGALLLRPEPAPEVREFAIMPPPGHNLQGGSFERQEFAISPDGSRIAFVARNEANNELALWVRDVGSASARRLQGTEGSYFPFWAPSGNSVGFFSDIDTLKRVDATGGQAVTILKGLPQTRGGTWSDDGVLLMRSRGEGGLPIHRVPSSGGPLRPVTSFEEGESEHLFPQFLPDGEHFLFYVRTVKEGLRGVYLGGLEEPTHRFLFPSDSTALYAEPGYLLFHRDGGLRAQRFDLRTMEVAGAVLSLPYDVEVTRFNQLNASVSRSGTLVYSSGDLRQQLTWYGRSGRRLGPLGPPGQHYSFRISPDGSQVAITRVGYTPASIWVIDAGGSVPVQVTSSQGNDVNGIWTDDGRALYFSSQRTGPIALFRVPANGGLEPQLVVPDTDVLDVVESADAFVRGFTPGPLTVLSLDGAWEPRTVAENTSVSQWISLVSPNGKWIAYWGAESGRDEIYVTSFPEPGRPRAVSREGGIRPRWSADGTELFFIGGDGFLYAAPVDTGDDFRSGEPVALFDLDGAVSYDVAPDGRILVNVPLPEPPHLNVVMDWTDALPR